MGEKCHRRVAFMKCLCVLCEGKTELLFCKEVLQTYLWGKDIAVFPTCLMTNKKMNARGGITSYDQVLRDIGLMLKQHRDNKENIYWFTTMFDLYALPCEFPMYQESINMSPYERVHAIQEAFAQDVVTRYSIDKNRFIPYIQLHEFEALVLCNINHLKMLYPRSSKPLERLEQSIQKEYYGNTEMVNNSPQTAPSKRIITALSDFYHYDKPQSGKETTLNMGIDKLRVRCKHFSMWINAIDKI